MLALLSPAKSIDPSPPAATVEATLPALIAETETLMATTRRLSQKEIQRLMLVASRPWLI